VVDEELKNMNNLPDHILDKILIVDDQAFNIEAMLIILRFIFNINTDKIVEKAFNGVEAVKAIVKDVEMNASLGFSGRSSYKLILMDCNMPLMNGYEATSIIRQFLHSRSISQPIISALTGHTEQIYINKAVLSGMNQVLKKPTD